MRAGPHNMSNSVGAFPRSGSESSFLLIQPLSSEQDASSSLPTERLESSDSWALYLLPALAVVDLGSNVLVGTMAAFRDDWRLTGWGCIRAGIVFWVGWAGKRGIRGGGGWLAAMTMITILLVFWHLNILFLTRSSDGPPRYRSDRHESMHGTLENDQMRASIVLGEDYKDYGSLQELYGLRILAPRICLSIFSVLIALIEELVHIRLARMYGPGDAFIIRRPRQTPSPFPHYQQSISAEGYSAGPSNLLHPNHSSPHFRSQRGHLNLQNQSDEPDLSDQLSFDRGSTSDYSSGTGTTTSGAIDQLEHSDELSDDSSDEFSDSEIVDIPPRLSMCAVLGGGSSRGLFERDVDSLERCLSRSFSRRRLRSSTAGSHAIDREEQAVGYGTFDEQGE